MSRAAFLLGLSILIASVWTQGLPQAATPGSPAAAQTPALPREDATRHAAVIKQYCSGCHNSRATTSATASGVVFDNIDLHAVARDAVLWEKVVRKLRAGAMPPSGAPHPDAAAIGDLLS